MQRRVLHERDPALAVGLNHLAQLLYRCGAVDEADALFQESLELLRGRVTPGHPLFVAALVGRGRRLLDEGRPREAEPLLREALEVGEQATGRGDRRPAKAALEVLLVSAGNPTSTAWNTPNTATA